MKTLLALLLLSPVAFADEIDDRIQRRSDQQDAESRARSHASIIQGNQAKIGAYMRYAEKHGGILSGNCGIREEECKQERGFGYDDRPRQFCWYNRHGRTSWPVGATDAYAIDDCRLVFADQMACALSYDSERSGLDKPTWYRADCYPEGRKPYVESFPESFVKRAGAARRR